MAILGIISWQILRLQSCKFIQPSKRSISSAVTYHDHHVKNQHRKRDVEYRNPKHVLFTPSQTQYQSLSSTTSQHKVDNESYEYKKVIDEHSLKVPSFGGSVLTKSNADISIKPADPTQYQNLDQAFVRLLSRVESNNEQAKLRVEQQDHKLIAECKIEDETKSSDYKLEVEVPIVYNVKVSAAANANVDVHDFMESNFVDIDTEDGNVNCHKSIKTENVIIHTGSGDVICQGALQGEVKIKTKSGNIVSEKRFVGPNAELETDIGTINVASSYSDQAKFSTNRGSMILKNVHNESNVTVHEHGNVQMQGVDGSTQIFINKGDLDIQISRITKDSRIHVLEGNVNLKLSESCRIDSSITAKDVIIDSKLDKLGEVEQNTDKDSTRLASTSEPQMVHPKLVIIAKKGRVSIEVQDWATSIGFKLPSMPS